MFRMSERSAGLFHFIPVANYNNTGDLWFNHVSAAYYKAHLVYSDDEMTCSNQNPYQARML